MAAGREKSPDNTPISEGIPMNGVTVIDHPLVQHKLTIMRKK
jgi:uracil phosphoribosyltransferase